MSFDIQRFANGIPEERDVADMVDVRVVNGSVVMTTDEDFEDLLEEILYEL